ncbi:hypothetical protein Tco_0893086 [Tanacetum coccineum]|uniref:Integrase, catalytic region, zinc finger, CCHC-type, peptidase aspartic, catalytic n=1 Tax=Tanacetum coccineum TaxID=301880 RepID=A0ABQ5C9B5_9ASTR
MSLSLAENVIVVGADNRPPMLDKTNYSSWASRMLLYIKGKEHGKLLVDSALNGPFQYGTMVEPRNETTLATIRARTYTDLTDEEKIRSELSLQERESKLYDNFDTFSSMPGETVHSIGMHTIGMTIHSYYMRFAQLICDMHTIDVKLAKDMHTTNFDHLYAHLTQHEAHANEVRLSRQRYPDQITLVANSPTCLNTNQYYPQLSSATQQYYSPPAPQHSYDALIVQNHNSGLVIPSFNPSDDPIANLNKLMEFVTTEFGPHFPQTNKQLRTSSNPRNHATIQYRRVTVQTVQGRQTHGYANNEARNTTTNQGVNRQGAASQARVVKCYNSAFQTDDLDAFDSDCDDIPSAKAVLMANLSSYDSDVLSEVPSHDTNIENDISYQSVKENQCSEQPSFDNDTEVDITSDNNIISYEQYLQETKTPVVQSTSSSAQQDALLMSVIKEMSSQVAKCNKVQQENIVVNKTLTAELKRYKEQAKLFEQRQKFDLNDIEKYIDGQLRHVIIDRNAKVADFEKQIHSLKLQLNATVESHKTLSTTVECLKKESKQTKDKYLDEVIDLQKKNKALDKWFTKWVSPRKQCISRRKVPALYDGNTIVKTHVALSVTDSEETLELAEESRLKMLAKQNDPSLKEKKVNIAPIDYVALNKLFEHFVKHFVPHKQLYVEQAFWLPILQPVSVKTPVPSELVLEKEIPCELPTISLGVEHIKEAFEKDVKPFAQTLKEYFCMFEHGLNKELKEMKAIFTQMETKVANCSVDKKYFEIEKKELSLDNDRLLEHIICQDVMNIVMHAYDHYDNVLHANNNSLDHDNSALDLLKHENDHLMGLLISQDLVHTAVNSLVAINDYKAMQHSFIDEYNETLVLKAELAKKNDMIENKESFQNNIPSHNQDTPAFKEFFIINELQAQLKAKNVSIEKLKEHIANIKGKNVAESVQNVQNSNVITSKVYKLDLQPLFPFVKHNRDAHVNYLKHTQENANTLCKIIEHARELRPLDSNLDSACKFVTHIQESLVYVNETCPSTKSVSNKLVAVTQINETRKVRFA